MVRPRQTGRRTKPKKKTTVEPKPQTKRIVLEKKISKPHSALEAKEQIKPEPEELASEDPVVPGPKPKAPKLTPEMVQRWTSTFGGPKQVPPRQLKMDAPPPAAGTPSPSHLPPRPLSPPPTTHGPVATVQPTVVQVKQEPGLQMFRAPPTLNFSQVGEDEVITLGDSDEEDGYELSQSQCMLQEEGEPSTDFSDVDELLRDSPSPDLSDSPTQEEEEDDSDIEILNESQTSLYAKIFKTVHKVEPKAPIEQPVKEERSLSPSLLDQVEDEEEQEEPDSEVIRRLVAEVPECDENMVRNAVRRARQGRVGELSTEEEEYVRNLVQEEGEERLVKRIAKNAGAGERQVKICLLELKDMRVEERQPVSEKLLLEMVKEKEELRKKIVALALERNVPEDLVREVVMRMVDFKGLFDQKKVLEEIDQEERSRILAEAFNITVDYAKKKLEESGMDESVASQAILDEENSRKEDQETEQEEEERRLDLDLGPPDLVRSHSPTLQDETEVETPFDEFDDDVDGLLKGFTDDEDEASFAPSSAPLTSTPAPSKEEKTPVSFRSKTMVPEPGTSRPKAAPLSSSRPPLISAPAMPPRRAFNRGVSFNTLNANKKQSKPVVGGAEAPPDGKLSKVEMIEMRKQKLKEVAESEKKQEPVKRKEDEVVPSQMKTLPCKNKTAALLAALQDDTPPPPARKKPPPPPPPRRLVPAAPLGPPGPPPARRGSEAGFLEEQSKMDAAKPVRKDKYATTSDGYKVPKKMSVSNVDYNVMSQDISRMPVKSKPLSYSGIAPQATSKGKGLRITWREPLGDIQFIDIERKPQYVDCPRKCSDSKAELQAGVQAKKNAASGKPSSNTIKMDDVYKSFLNWSTNWLTEYKKPELKDLTIPVHQPFTLLPLTAQFSNVEEYVRIFLPLMLHELWSSVTQEVERKEGARSVPLIIQEVAQEPDRPFKQVRCLSLLTEREARGDLAAEGALVRLDLKYRKTDRGAEVRPVFGYVQRFEKKPYRIGGGGSFGENDKAAAVVLEKVARKDPRGSLAWLVTYTVRTKEHLRHDGMQLVTDRHIYMKALARIRTELRKFEALLYVPESKLVKELVSPSSQQSVFRPPAGSEHLNPRY